MKNNKISSEFIKICHELIYYYFLFRMYIYKYTFVFEKVHFYNSLLLINNLTNSFSNELFVNIRIHMNGLSIKLNK